MAAAAVVKATLQQSRAILSTGRPARCRGRLRSELVAQAAAHGVDIYLSDIREADVFPLGTQEQTADQIDVDPQACRIAIQQLIVLSIRRAAESWRRAGGCDVQHGCGTANIRVA